jgi:hypothetical protein
MQEPKNSSRRTRSRQILAEQITRNRGGKNESCAYGWKPNERMNQPVEANRKIESGKRTNPQPRKNDAACQVEELITRKHDLRDPSDG